MDVNNNFFYYDQDVSKEITENGKDLIKESYINFAKSEYDVSEEAVIAYYNIHSVYPPIFKSDIAQQELKPIERYLKIKKILNKNI